MTLPRYPPVETLTPREMDVLQLLAEGLPNRKIAARLKVNERTVKYHVSAIIAKLSARNRTDAVMRAIELGLVSL